MLMGDAAARAERPARKMAVAYMMAVFDLLFDIGSVVGVERRVRWKRLSSWVATVVFW